MIKVVFMGTPAFSVPCLKSLLASDVIEVVGVVTQPDRPAGRGKKLVPPPVKTVAEEAGLPIFQPTSLKKDAELLDWLRCQNVDFFVTIAFGQILNQEILDIPQRGTVNVHASLLPQYRGANPIQQAIIDGQPETGLTTMLTDIGVDTGDMLQKVVVGIDENMTAQQLHDALSEEAGPLLVYTLTGLVDGSVQPQPQNHDDATHSPKAKKEHAFIDLAQSALMLHNRIRGQQPWPGASVNVVIDGQPQLLKITESLLVDAEQTGTIGSVDLNDGLLTVQTGQGVLGFKTVQPQGKKPMAAKDWVNGLRLDNLSVVMVQTIKPEPVVV